MTVQMGMNPAVVGVPVDYAIEVAATDFAPLDGQLLVSAPSGESCIDDSTPPPAVDNTVFYSCQIAYSQSGAHSLTVSWQGSTTHMPSEQTGLIQQVISSEDIFHDRFED